LFHIIHAQLPKPDLLVYLHKDIPNLQRNIKLRGREYEQQIADEYLEKLDRGYWEYFRQNANQRIIVIDTNELDFVANEKDYQFVKALLNIDYEPGLHRISGKDTQYIQSF
jgi:deoxyadenosine/deoxycytidine kinase